MIYWGKAVCFFIHQFFTLYLLIQLQLLLFHPFSTCNQEVSNACTCIYLHCWGNSNSNRIYLFQQLRERICTLCLTYIPWCTIFLFILFSLTAIIPLVNLATSLLLRSWSVEFFDQHTDRFIMYDPWLDRGSRYIFCPSDRVLAWNMGKLCWQGLRLHLSPPCISGCWRLYRGNSGAVLLLRLSSYSFSFKTRQPRVYSWRLLDVWLLFRHLWCTWVREFVYFWTCLLLFLFLSPKVLSSITFYCFFFSAFFDIIFWYKYWNNSKRIVQSQKDVYYSYHFQF